MSNRNNNNEFNGRKNAVYAKAVGICDKCLGKNTQRIKNVFYWRCTGELVFVILHTSYQTIIFYIQIVISEMASFNFCILQGASGAACPQVPPHQNQMDLNLFIAQMMSLGFTEVSHHHFSMNKYKR